MIVFLGPPGAGKGTQSRFLKARDSFNIFSLGEVLRGEVKKESELGLEIKNRIKEGNFISTELVIDIVAKNSKNLKDTIVDGFPRTVEQALFYDKKKTMFDLPDEKLVLDLGISPENLKNRLKIRKMCSSCEAAFLPDMSYCMFCSSSDFYIREDDNLKSVEKRIENFMKEHQKLVDFYKKKGCYVLIDADKNVEEVYSSIRSCIKDKNLL